MSATSSAVTRHHAVAAIPLLAVVLLVVVAVNCTTAIGQATEPTPAVSALTHANNTSGHDLFVRVIAPDDNVVLSPYSIGVALSMALSAARGTTQSQMIAALHYPSSRAEIDAANSTLMTMLASRGAGAPAGNASLETANALLVTGTGVPIAADYLSTLRQAYGAELFTGADAAAVNDWVSKKTNGRIRGIVDRLSPRTVAVLVNAIYFRQPWQIPFNKLATREEDFTPPASTKVAVAMMHAQDRYAVTTGNAYTAIRLPYVGNTLAMLIVLPDGASTADAVVRGFTGDAIEKMAAALKSAPLTLVDLAMPRFTAGFRASLVEPLKAMGMTMAFNPVGADFSGMTGRPPSELPIAIGDVIHQAVVEVSEEGTEAGAATITGLRTTTARVRPRPFHIDRPFLFYIIDDATMSILFEGRVVNPRQTADAGPPLR